MNKLRRFAVLLIIVVYMLTARLSHAQESVCDLFSDLKAANGSQLIIAGELIISAANTGWVAGFGSKASTRSGAKIRPPTTSKLRTLPLDIIMYFINARRFSRTFASRTTAHPSD